jgi:hypothetical protein
LQVQPDELFMSASEFKAKFLEPITEGQQHDATRYQRQKMARQLSVLQDRTAVSTWNLIMFQFVAAVEACTAGVDTLATAGRVPHLHGVLCRGASWVHVSLMCAPTAFYD